VAHKLVAANSHHPKSPDVGYGHPNADGLLLLKGRDSANPTTDSALIEVGSELARSQNGFKQCDVIEVQKSHNKSRRGEDCQHDCVPPPTESDIKRRAEQKRPESRRECNGGQAGDHAFGHLAVTQQLWDREGDYSSVETERQVG
jgi:hypothetical protein